MTDEAEISQFLETGVSTISKNRCRLTQGSFIKSMISKDKQGVFEGHLV